MPEITQDDIFWNQEADNYFHRRNHSDRSDADRLQDDLPLELIRRNAITASPIAEIGAYNGFRLAEMNAESGCDATAFEPSSLAIEEGRRLYPQVQFIRNTSTALDAADGDFNMVIIDFVLHWIDRSNLFRTIAEADRILAEDGWLIVGDVWTDAPHRTRYHHRPDMEIWTYKQDYAALFLSSNCYQEVDRMNRGALQRDPVPRCCTLLQKTLHAGYPVSGRSV